jgi:conjugal transfer ATP-binding protein TraC
MQMLLKQSNSAVDVLSEVFRLTEEEKKRLAQFPVGQGLFFAGQSHVHVQIIASPTEHTLITTNPQQLQQLQDVQNSGQGVQPQQSNVNAF